MGSAVRLVRSSRMVCRWVTSPSMLISWSCTHTHTHINGYSGLTGCHSPALVDLNHHTCSTDQHRLQHADEAAVTRSFFYQRSAHGSLLRLLQDGVTHIDVLQRAVQLAPGLSLPYRNTHTGGTDEDPGRNCLLTSSVPCSDGTSVPDF